MNSVLFAVFQTRPAAAHLLVAVLVEVAVPVPPVLVPIAVVDGVPVAVADAMAVTVFDGVPVAVANPVAVTVFAAGAVPVPDPVLETVLVALAVAVVNGASVAVADPVAVAVFAAAPVSMLEALESLAASATGAGKPSAVPESATHGAASAVGGGPLLPQDAARARITANTAQESANRFFHTVRLSLFKEASKPYGAAFLSTKSRSTTKTTSARRLTTAAT